MLATDVVRKDRHESSGPAVVDVKPAEHARDLDRLGRVDVQDGLRRHTLPDPLVGPVLVEVQLVLAHKRCEMEIIDQQHVVEQLSSDTAHEPLGDGVHIRCANRRPDHLGASALGCAVELCPELVVAIPQQHGRSVPIHRGVWVPEFTRQNFRNPQLRVPEILT